MSTYYPYPYLYHFTQDPKAEDISYYNSDQTLIAIAKKEGKIIALATGIPLINYNYDKFVASQQFKNYSKVKMDEIFLLDELLFEDNLSLNQRYKVGKELIRQMEASLLNSSFKHIAKLIVDRAIDHPLRTYTYFDETKLLNELKYVSTDIVISVPWTTRISENERRYQDNPMRYWVKERTFDGLWDKTSELSRTRIRER
jgi:hypothetical protein